MKFSVAATFIIGASLMSQQAFAQDVATDPNLDPAVRAFLVEVNKNPSPTPLWELPQPQPQDVITGLQNATTVDMSGVTISEHEARAYRG
jgi:acetyl esterase